MLSLWIITAIGVAFVLAYHYASLPVWTITAAVFLLLFSKFSGVHGAVIGISWLVFLGIALILNIRSIRQLLISKSVLALYRRIMPSMSNTEKEALNAGTVSWEGDLFSGNPDLNKLIQQPFAKLSKAEKDFLSGPVDELCSTINDWDITHNRTDLPTSMWKFIKDNKFCGMIIPKKYGGLGFSASAVSAVLVKIYGISVSVATTVSVPNSLGPGELLVKYGTSKQKDHYLPRLANGTDIPCFALTSPTAGSDAASLTDTGVICRAKHKGKTVVGIRLNFDKRYITLAPVATVLGLAFKLYDPDHLIGEKEDIGITCALIPTDTSGVTIGRRHFPVNTAFMNGPVQGKDVFIPLDWIIGGEKMAGQGWRMLMECLSAGRAISLPSSSVGGAKVAALAGGAYSTIRRQFNTSIGKFEGIEEALARIGGNAYIMDAALKFTAAAIDQGEEPAVASAIVKYHITERGRKVVNDVMDIHGGKGICLGPKNYLGRSYQMSPISITVEGANILTRSLIIFGQGAIRCHPYVLEELEAASANDLTRFDKALFRHIGFTISNNVRTLFISLTRAYFVKTPGGPLRRYYQLLKRYSSALAFISELSMLALGGNLKRLEKLSARLGDVLSMLYLISAVMKKYESDGRPKEDLPLVEWACEDLLFQMQHALDGVIKNFPSRTFAFAMRLTVFPYGKHLSEPSDALGHQVASLLLTPNAARSRLGEGVYLEPTENNPVGIMEQALPKILAVAAIEKTVLKAIRKGDICGNNYDEQLLQAVTARIITKAEAKRLQEVRQLREEIIAVDDFDYNELARAEYQKTSAKKIVAIKKPNQKKKTG